MTQPEPELVVAHEQQQPAHGDDALDESVVDPEIHDYAHTDVDMALLMADGGLLASRHGSVADALTNCPPALVIHLAVILAPDMFAQAVLPRIVRHLEAYAATENENDRLVAAMVNGESGSSPALPEQLCVICFRLLSEPGLDLPKTRPQIASLVDLLFSALGSETPDRAMTMLCTRIFQDILMGGDAAKLYLVEDILRNAHSVFHAKSPLCPEGFELLAHVFEFMTTHPEHVQSLERMMSDICDAAPWRWDQTVQLISMLRELPLGESCQLMIVTKIRESQFPANPPDDDVPALVYQTLLLASSVPTSEKRALFKAISLLFPDIVQNPALTPREWLVLKTRLLAKESMTLNHMWTILQHDPVIRSEYLSYLKTLTRSSLTPFNVSLMLLLSRNMQCRVSVYTYIKREIDATIVLELESKRLKWLSGFTPFHIPSVRHIFAQLLLRTDFNPDLVEPLVELACQILDAHSAAAASVATAPAGLRLPVIPGLSFTVPAGGDNATSTALAQGRSSPHDATDPAAIASHLSTMLLVDLFTRSQLAQADILSQIEKRVESRSAGLARFADLVQVLTHRTFSAQLLVREHGSAVGTILENVQHLTGTITHRMFCVLLPLARWSVSFRDAAMLFLRKAMLSRREDLRELSVVAGVYLAALASTRPEIGIGFGSTAFLHEVVGMLRRVLMASADVRLVLYQQLATAMAQSPPALADAVLPILLRHIGSFEDAQGALAFGETVATSTGTVVEPLHWLIKAVTVATQHASPGSASVASAQTNLILAANQLRMRELPDFGIGSGCNVGPSGPAQQEAYNRCMVIVASFEALLEFACVTYGEVVEDAEHERRHEILTLLEALYDRVNRFSAVVRKQYLDARGKKSLNVALHSDLCLMQPFVLGALHAPIIRDERVVAQKLRTAIECSPTGRIAPHPWAVPSATMIADAAEPRLLERDENGDVVADAEPLVPAAADLVPVMRFFLAQLTRTNLAAIDRKDKSKAQVPSLAVEALSSTLTESLASLSLTQFATLLSQFNEAANGGEARQEGEDGSESLVQLLLEAAHGLSMYQFEREAALVLQLLVSLQPHLPHALREHVHDTMMERMGDLGASSVPVIRDALALLVHSKWHDTDALVVLVSIVDCMVLSGATRLVDPKMGGVSPPAAPKLELLLPVDDPKALDAATNVVLSAIERGFKEIDWALAEYKNEYMKRAAEIASSPAMDARILGFENRIAKRLAPLLHGLNGVAHLWIAHETMSTMLKLYAHAHATLAAFFQVKDAMHSRPEAHFEAVVALAAALRDWSVNVVLHFDNVIQQVEKDALERRKRKVGGAGAKKGKGKGKGKAGAGAAGKKKSAKGGAAANDDQDELASEVEEHGDGDDGDRSSLGFKGAAVKAKKRAAAAADEDDDDDHGGIDGADDDDDPAVDAAERTKSQRRARAYGKLVAELTQKRETADVHMINLAAKYKSLSRYLRRSDITDFRWNSIAAPRAATPANPDEPAAKRRRRED